MNAHSAEQNPADPRSHLLTREVPNFCRSRIRARPPSGVRKRARHGNLEFAAAFGTGHYRSRLRRMNRQSHLTMRAPQVHFRDRRFFDRRRRRRSHQRRVSFKGCRKIMSIDRRRWCASEVSLGAASDAGNPFKSARPVQSRQVLTGQSDRQRQQHMIPLRQGNCHVANQEVPAGGMPLSCRALNAPLAGVIL